MSAEETRANVQRQLFLRTMSIARPGAQMSTLMKSMKDAFFQAGQTLYRQGDAPDQVFFVVSGLVELQAAGEPPIEFDARSAVGVLDMLQDRPHVRTAVARTDTHVLVIKADDWLEMLEDNFESARSAIVGISTNSTGFAKTLDESAGFVESSSGVEPAPERRLNLVERLLVLREVQAFRATRIQALTSIAEAADELRHEEGVVLFREGDTQASLFVVAHGSVELASEEPRVRASFGPRSLVGGFSAFAVAAGFTATARSASVLLRIGREDLFDVMEDHFEVARSVLAFLATERARLGALRAAVAAKPAVALPVRA